MSTELSRVIETVVKEKNLQKEEVVQAVEEAVSSAVERLHRRKDSLGEFEAQYNEDEGTVELFQYKEVVDEVSDRDSQINVADARVFDAEAGVGEEIGVKVWTSGTDLEDSGHQSVDFNLQEFTRVAIQNAKQKILQKVKEAEGRVIREEFRDYEGRVVSGTVRRIERRNVVVDLGRAEAVLPYSHKAPKEYYEPKDRIKALLLEINEEKRLPLLILSRVAPDFVKRLFETEVPEIADGIIEIKALARDPGLRMKIAVYSHDPDVDPVGACVGIRGARVQNVIQDLQGEKIDIVPWSSNLGRFVSDALAPAVVNKVIIDESNNQMEVVVDEDQLTLAIGRRGQNVRLASNLTNWKIDIKTEEQVRVEKENSMTMLASLPSVGEMTATILYNEGFRKVEDIAFADPENIRSLLGDLSENDVKSMMSFAKVLLKEKLEKEAEEKAAAEAAEAEEEKTAENTGEEGEAPANT